MKKETIKQWEDLIRENNTAFLEGKWSLQTIIPTKAVNDFNWGNPTKVAKYIAAKGDILNGQERGVYHWSGKQWENIEETANKRSDSIEKIIHTEALADKVDFTAELDYSKISAEIIRLSKNFPRDEDNLLIGTKYNIYLFQNGTLYYNQKTGDYIFKEGFDKNDFVRAEENPIFPYSFVENDTDISIPLGKMDEWGVDTKQLLYIAALSLFEKKQSPAYIYYLVGEGSNGKSIYQKMLESLIPKKARSALDIGKLSGDKDGSEILEASYINISGEVAIEDLDGDFLKKITGGDTIPVNPKYMKPYFFRPTCKCICSSNGKPSLRKISNGDIRRWLAIEFKRLFPEDPTFFDTYFAPYLSQIFFNLLKLSKDLKTNGMYINQQYLIDTREMILEGNSVAEFIKEYTVMFDKNIQNNKGGKGIDGRVLYNRYKEWIPTTGKQPLNRSNFFRDLDRVLKCKSKVPDTPYGRYLSYITPEKVEDFHVA